MVIHQSACAAVRITVRIIIADEIIDEPSSTVADARAVLAQLRGRLESLERDVMPTKH